MEFAKIRVSSKEPVCRQYENTFWNKIAKCHTSVEKSKAQKYTFESSICDAKANVFLI